MNKAFTSSFTICLLVLSVVIIENVYAVSVRDFQIDCIIPSPVNPGETLEGQCQVATQNHPDPIEIELLSLSLVGGPPLIIPNPVEPLTPDGVWPFSFSFPVDPINPPGEYPMVVRGTSGDLFHEFELPVTLLIPGDPCKCEELFVSPAELNDKIFKVSGNIKGADEVNAKIFQVKIEIESHKHIVCTEGVGKCSGLVFIEAKSDEWSIDSKKGTIEEQTQKAVDDKGADLGEKELDGSWTIKCEGPCGEQTEKDFKTIYTAEIKKSKGGIITNKVSGKVTIEFKPFGCDTNSGWTMILVYNADIKKGTVEIDPNLSDYDGDGLNNLHEKAKKTNLWDPDSDGDGVKDGKDKHPTNPNKS